MATNEEVGFELEYWKALLGDLHDLSEMIGQAAESTMEVPISIAQSLLVPEGARGEYLLRASSMSRDTMNTLHKMYGPMNRVVELVDGRIKVLVGES